MDETDPRQRREDDAPTGILPACASRMTCVRGHVVVLSESAHAELVARVGVVRHALDGGGVVLQSVGVAALLDAGARPEEVVAALRLQADGRARFVRGFLVVRDAEPRAVFGRLGNGQTPAPRPSGSGVRSYGSLHRSLTVAVLEHRSG